MSGTFRKQRFFWTKVDFLRNLMERERERERGDNLCL